MALPEECGTMTMPMHSVLSQTMQFVAADLLLLGQLLVVIPCWKLRNCLVARQQRRYPNVDSLLHVELPNPSTATRPQASNQRRVRPPSSALIGMPGLHEAQRTIESQHLSA